MNLKISFWKMSGSGNDFVVVDNRRKTFPKSLSAWAKKLCHRQEGIGADGLLLLEKSRTADFRMVYFNADGSRASMCGNGARCTAWFAHAIGAAGAESVMETDAGPVAARVTGDLVMISLGAARDYRPPLPLRAGGRRYRASFLNTGVPHAVVFVPRVDTVDVQRLGREIRHHRVFGSAGANVNFVQRVAADRLKVRTYERGVEGETMACGTGVTASAVVAALEGKAVSPTHCQTAGGDILEVRFRLDPGHAEKPAEGLSLKGPVRVTFKGQTAF